MQHHYYMYITCCAPLLTPATVFSMLQGLAGDGDFCVRVIAIIDIVLISSCRPSHRRYGVGSRVAGRRGSVRIRDSALPGFRARLAPDQRTSLAAEGMRMLRGGLMRRRPPSSLRFALRSGSYRRYRGLPAAARVPAASAEPAHGRASHYTGMHRPLHALQSALRPGQRQFQSTATPALLTFIAISMAVIGGRTSMK